MKQELESILKKGKMVALIGLMYLTIGCASSRFYVEPKVGVIIPRAAKEQAYDPSATTGGSFGLGGKRVGIEAGLDYFYSSREYIETKSTLSRVNLNLDLSKPTAKVKLYLIAGINSLNESSTIDIPEFDVHDKVKNTTRGLEFGIGTTIRDRIDARITYTTMPASENVKGMINLTTGYRFLFGRR